MKRNLVFILLLALFPFATGIAAPVAKAEKRSFPVPSSAVYATRDQPGPAFPSKRIIFDENEVIQADRDTGASSMISVSKTKPRKRLSLVRVHFINELLKSAESF